MFLQGRLPKGVGQHIDHMFIYFHYKIQSLKLFIKLTLAYKVKNRVLGNKNWVLITLVTVETGP